MSSEGEKIADLELPLGLDYKKWQFLTKGLLKSNADKTPVSAEELSKFTNVPKSKVISNIKFLKLLGIATAESKSSAISLTEDGAKYAHSLFLPDAKLEKELLSKFVSTGLQNLVDFYHLHSVDSDFSFDKLFNQIKLLSRTNDKKGALRDTHTDYRNAIYTIIEILVAAGVLPESFLPSNNEPKSERINNRSTMPLTRTKTTFEIPVNMQRDWMIKLFTAISRTTSSTKIDKDFITANVNNNRHEGTILSFAQFLGITDSKGGHGENYDKLRLYGTPEFSSNLAEVVNAKYVKVLSVADLRIAQRNGLEALIMKQYGMNKPQAERAVNTLIRLCELANISLSEDLVPRKVSTEKPTAGSSKERPKPTEVPSIESDIARLDDEKVSSYDPESIVVKIQIQIDAKDENAFSNTLKFIKELRTSSTVRSTEILVPTKAENNIASV